MKTTKFPVARIKKIMQKDEEVGKVAQATPVVISKALELFLQLIIDEASAVTVSRGSKKVEAYHLKHAIETTEMLDFLKELVQEVPDPSAGGTIDLDGPDNKRSRKGKKAATAGDDDEEMDLDDGEAPKPKRKRRKKKDDADEDDDGAPVASGSRKAAGGRGGGAGRGRGRKASAAKAPGAGKVERTKAEARAPDMELVDEDRRAALRDDAYDYENGDSNGQANGSGYGREDRIEENFDEEEED